MFTFREFPSDDRIRELGREYPDMEFSASQAFVRMMHISSMAYEAVNTYMSRHGLTHGRFLIMMLLGKIYPDGLSPSEIAHKIGVTRATVTSLVEKLERDGLVLREHRTDDRRAVTVRVTEQGTDLIKRIFPGHLDRVKLIMSALDEDEREQFVSLLSKVHSGISSLPPINSDDEVDSQ